MTTSRAEPVVISLLSSPSPPFGRQAERERSPGDRAPSALFLPPAQVQRSPPKRARPPAASTPAASASKRPRNSKDDSATADRQPKLSSMSWGRSISHQVVNLSVSGGRLPGPHSATGMAPSPSQGSSLTPLLHHPTLGPRARQREERGGRMTLLKVLPREIICLILANLHFDDIRSLLRADRRLRPFVHLPIFAPRRKQLAQYQFHERAYDEMVKRRGDAIYQTDVDSQQPSSSARDFLPATAAGGRGPSSSGSPNDDIEKAFVDAYVDALQALRLQSPPVEAVELVNVVQHAFDPAKPSTQLRQFASDLLLGEARASDAFELFDSTTAVELLSLIRLYCCVLRVSRGFARDSQTEALQMLHFINADCRDAVRGFFAPRRWRPDGVGFQLTEEQRRFVNRDAQRGELIKVQAFAGTGKTRSLVAYAKARPRQRFLYIAFNTSAAAEARERFSGSNVDCRTMHSLCLSQTQLAKNQKVGTIKPRDVVALFDGDLPTGKRTKPRPSRLDESTQPDPRLSDTVVATYILRTMNAYMYSDDKDLDADKHVPKAMQKETDLPPGRVLDLSKRLWEAVTKGQDSRGKPVPCPHDAYVKMLQLTKPSQPIAIFSRYDVLLLDEAQDLSAAQVSILLRASRHCGIIIVGDAHQKIYGFRGGTARAFNDGLYPPTATFQLTQSFRFGDSVAMVASKLLGLKAAAPWRERPERPWLTGVKGCGDAVYTLKAAHPTDSAMLAAIATQPLAQPAGVGRTEQKVLKHTRIFRSNKVLVETALLYGVSLDDPHRIYLKTAAKLSQSSIISLLRDGFILFNGRGGPLSSGSILREFGSWKELLQRVEAEEQTGDGMLGLVASLEDLFRSDDFLDRLESLKSRFSSSEKEASIVLTTCHQAKGLEWDRVVVADDFRPALSSGRGRMQVDSLWLQDELNLMYVAVTRAKKELVISGAVLEWLAALDGVCQLKAEAMDGIKCLGCGQEGKKGVVRVFRMGEHDFVSRADAAADAERVEAGHVGQRRRGSGGGGGEDDDEGPRPPFKKAVGCFDCLAAHAAELDEDVVQFLKLHRAQQQQPTVSVPLAAGSRSRSRSSGSGGELGRTTRPPTTMGVVTHRSASDAAVAGGRPTTTTASTSTHRPSVAVKLDRTRLPLVVHAHRQANWDRIQVEGVNTVQRWCFLDRFFGLLPLPPQQHQQQGQQPAQIPGLQLHPTTFQHRHPQTQQVQQGQQAQSRAAIRSTHTLPR